jgi:hypothetical protein
MGLFALGETMMQPTIPAITDAMAPDHPCGRCTAVDGVTDETVLTADPVTDDRAAHGEPEGVRA